MLRPVLLVGMLALVHAASCFCGASDDGVQVHASAGQCKPDVSLKGPDGTILIEGFVAPNWTSKPYDFKTGDKVSLSVIAENCMREPACKLTKDGVEFGERRIGESGNLICFGTVP